MTTILKDTQQKIELSRIGIHNKEAIVLLSGGMDSIVTASLLRDMGFSVHGLFINYGQPNLEAERLVVRGSGFRYREVALSGLTMSDTALVDIDAWVPLRNTQFLMQAALEAERYSASVISLGFCKDDIGVYADNSWIHHKLAGLLFSYSLGREVEVLLPLYTWSKMDVVRYVLNKKLNTVSCWHAKVGKNNELIPCGNCNQCIEVFSCITQIKEEEI